MTIAEYLASIKEHLLTDPLVSSFDVIRERLTLTDGHLRACLTLSDDSLLEFPEYAQVSADRQIQVATYSYHWADRSGNLIRRWDNAPPSPTLSAFPHHIHDGPNDTVSSGQPMSIFVVLDEIGRRQR